MKKITYLIDQSNKGQTPFPPRLVEGYAFQIPDWPEFHACVRWCGERGKWIVDHYETGYYVTLRRFNEKEHAPILLRAKLRKIGRKKVHKALKKHGCMCDD